MDEVSTIEVTVDYDHMSIHLLDVSGAVYPIFDYKISDFILSEEFLKMINILSTKQLIRKNNELKEDFHIHDYVWYFYTQNKPIRKLIGFSYKFVIIQENDKSLITSYLEYVV